MGLYMGFSLYGCQISFILRLFNYFFPLNNSLNIILLYLSSLIITIYGIINALITRIENITLKYPGYNNKIKILLLSDIHLGAIHQKNSVIRIVQESKQLNPDIVVIAGDLADGSLQVKQDWLKPFDTLTVPVLFVTGNHEELNPKNECKLSYHYSFILDNIYKYKITDFNEKENKAIFSCDDSNCAANAEYSLINKLFILKNEHNIAHNKHEYIQNMSSKDSQITEYMNKNKILNLQIMNKS